MGNPSKISQFFLAVKHSRRTYFFTMTKVRLEEALTELIPKSTKKIFHAEATGFTVITNPFPSFPLHAQKAQSVYDPMFQRSHSDFYSLLCHVKWPYQISSSRAFMWLRWLNKNAVRGADPDLWPHRNVHTNVKPITSFLLRATTCLNRSSCWHVIHQPQERRVGRKGIK